MTKHYSCIFALKFLLLLGVAYCNTPVLALAQSTASTNTQHIEKLDRTESGQVQVESHGMLDADFNKEPTFIKSTSLLLKSGERVFEYTGSVEVIQGDMTLTCDALEGFYDEHNQIDQLIAKSNVVITKGENIRATSERAHYERATETITLTESPELQQTDSVLTADLIRIYLQEDRSVAEGQVRVKLVNKEDGKEKKKKP